MNRQALALRTPGWGIPSPKCRHQRRLLEVRLYSQNSRGVNMLPFSRFRLCVDHTAGREEVRTTIKVSG